VALFAAVGGVEGETGERCERTRKKNANQFGGVWLCIEIERVKEGRIPVGIDVQFQF
jgi:hypothetical protein